MQKQDDSFQVPNRRYAKISIKKRAQLIDLIVQQHFSLRKAADRLRLKKSTAERILNRYRKDGTFFESKQSKKARLEIEGLQKESQPDIFAETLDKKSILPANGRRLDSNGHEVANSSQKESGCLQNMAYVPFLTFKPSVEFCISPVFQQPNDVIQWAWLPWTQ